MAQNTELARDLMTKSQLWTCNQQDDVITEALLAVKRENFVPKSFEKCAYADDDIPLGDDRFLMEPLTFAKMLAVADIQSHHTVLIVGGALGYSAAVIAQFSGKVISGEEQAGLVSKARQNLGNISNVEVVTSPLSAGCPAHQPYDVIFIEGAAQCVPQAIYKELAEGGKIVYIHNQSMRPGTRHGMGHISTITRMGNEFIEQSFDTVFAAVLPSFVKKEQFVF